MSCFPPYRLREEYSRPSHWVRLCADAVRLTYRASSGHPNEFWPIFTRAIQLLGREQFRGGEIRQLELLEKSRDGRPFAAVSRRAMVRIASELNPPDARPLVGNKSVFARECDRRGLPAPRLLGVYSSDRSGWAVDGSAADATADWRDFFLERCPDEFVIKPAVDGHGRGVRIFSRLANRRFRDACDTILEAGELIAWMAAAGRRHGTVIQERVRGHPELERLSGSPFLQTVRCFTILDRDGEPHLLQAVLKLIAGTNFVDNFQYGATGNLIAPVSLEDGVLERALTPNPRGGFSEVQRHPDTGAVISGFQLPAWREMHDLALLAARRFAPLRLVGWDIASTWAGPILIEGNWNSDAPNPVGTMDCVLAGLRRWA